MDFKANSQILSMKHTEFLNKSWIRSYIRKSTDRHRREGRPMASSDPKLQAAITRIRATMKEWGITNSLLATRLGVSRQYLWQVVHRRVHLSVERAQEIELVLNRLVADCRRNSTFGERLRAARRSAGFTLKEVASMIGYSWAGVERWEKDQCRPKPGVLFHLMSIYSSSTAFLNERAPAATRDVRAPAAGFALAGFAVAGRPAETLGGFNLPMHTRAQAHAAMPPYGAGGATMGVTTGRRRRAASG
jgi:transcriptional regulator with XRE-family HTH domain